MRLIKNSGIDRVLDVLRAILLPGSTVDVASPEISVFAFAEIRDLLAQSAACRLIIPDPVQADLSLLGNEADRGSRNKLQARWLARICSEWISANCQIHQVPSVLPQSAIVVRHGSPVKVSAIIGSCPITTAGLGLTPGNQLGIIQHAESSDEAASLRGWFEQLWTSTANGQVKDRFVFRLREVFEHRSPECAYQLALANAFSREGEELDEDRIVKSATGIKTSLIWKKLFRFQRDGVVGAIDKLERFGGCIIADSVGLGKTFEALAVIKYYELRNDRVLVLCPKRLRDNWTITKPTIAAT
jgi:hypothetical protein